MRLDPTPATIKKLFALSGNCCAFPGCSQPLVDKDGSVIGQVCHIEAAEKGGERYNRSQTDEERRGFENLMLLCANHHVVTDNVTKYPVGRMRQMKTRHESKWRDKPFDAPNEAVLRTLANLASRQEVENFGSGPQVVSQHGPVTYHAHGPSIDEIMTILPSLLEAHFPRLLKTHLSRALTSDQDSPTVPVSADAIARRESADIQQRRSRYRARASLSKEDRLKAARSVFDQLHQSKLALDSPATRRLIVATLWNLRPGAGTYGSLDEEKILAGQLHAYMAWILANEGKIGRAEIELDASRLLLGSGFPLDGAVVLTIARWHYRANRLNEADRLAREALSIFRQLQPASTMAASCLSDLGGMAKDRGNIDEALTFLTEALAIEKQLERRKNVATLSLEIGRLRHVREEYDKAIPFLESALKAYRDIGDRDGECWALTILAISLKRQNKSAQARKCLSAARKLGLKLTDAEVFRT